MLFHIYIKTKGMTTYQYILNKRGQNKVIPGNSKDLLLLKKARPEHNVDKEDIEESREAVNITSSLAIDGSKENTREQTSAKLKEEMPIDPLNRTKSNGESQLKAKKYSASEEPTDLKHKSIDLKTEKETAVNLTKRADSFTNQEGQKLKPKNTLKDDEGSFVLSKPVNPRSSNDLALELENMKPKLELPVSTHTHDDKEPGEWTLRQRNQEALETEKPL